MQSLEHIGEMVFDGIRVSKSEWVYGQFNEDGMWQEEPREFSGVNVWSTGNEETEFGAEGGT